MKKKLFTVGPTEMFPSTLEIAGQQVPYFRNDEFSSVVLECERFMKRLAGASPEDKFVLLTASGTGAMEAVVMNCLGPENRALVIDGGSFGHRFAQLCSLHGVPYESLELEFGETLVPESLAPFDGKGFDTLLVNADETSTGQLYDLEMLSAFCKKNGMAFIVDAISSFTCDPMNMSDLGIDALIVSSQKGLSISPGLSIVLLSESVYSARVKDRKASCMYFDFNDCLENGKRGQTPFTPAVGIVYELLDRVERIDAQGGVEQVVDHTAELARDFRKKIDGLPVSMPTYPLSNALTPILFESHDARVICHRLEEEYGLVVNPCGGEMAQKMIRVGHMGNLTPEDNTELAGALQAILADMG